MISVVPERPNITSELVLVTPSMAAEMLQANTHNRGLRRPSVRRFVTEMSAGRWYTTHQGVAFYDDGTMADGQHRLHAIVDSGRPQWILVTRGIATEAMHAIDRGDRRSELDSLKFIGVEARQHWSAAARCLMLQDHARHFKLKCWDARYKPSSEAFCDAYVQLHSFIQWAHTPGASAPVTAAIAAAAITHEANPDAMARVEDFRKVLTDKMPVSPTGDSAAMQLVLQIAGSKGAHSVKARHELYCRTCNAIRLFIDCRPVKQLRASAAAAFTVPCINWEGVPTG